MNEHICALTGHRDLPDCFDRERLRRALEERCREGYNVFLCGMAMGFDLTALEYLCALKKQFDIRLVACIPFPRQSDRYPAAEKGRYERLLRECDERVVLAERYSRVCYFVRDRYMVDRADGVLAYCTRETGGTAYTLRYARLTGKRVYLI